MRPDKNQVVHAIQKNYELGDIINIKENLIGGNVGYNYEVTTSQTLILPKHLKFLLVGNFLNFIHFHLLSVKSVLLARLT